MVTIISLHYSQFVPCFCAGVYIKSSPYRTQSQPMTSPNVDNFKLKITLLFIQNSKVILDILVKYANILLNKSRPLRLV